MWCLHVKENVAYGESSARKLYIYSREKSTGVQLCAGKVRCMSENKISKLQRVVRAA
jgi:hypothetical protein